MGIEEIKSFSLSDMGHPHALEQNDHAIRSITTILPPPPPQKLFFKKSNNDHKNNNNYNKKCNAMLREQAWIDICIEFDFILYNTKQRALKYKIAFVLFFFFSFFFFNAKLKEERDYTLNIGSTQIKHNKIWRELLVKNILLALV